MTSDKEKRVKIAEACGWKLISNGPNSSYWNNGPELPDYLNDLNTMHEAEKTLTDAEHCRFRDLLWEQVDAEIDDIPENAEKQERAIHDRTPRQRAEAFGKTLNLW